MGSVTISDSVETIGSNAFYNCSEITNLTIGEGVTSIGNSAFSGCIEVTSVTIGSGVIGYEAFYDVAHIYYNGTATGRPWGAKVIN